MTSPIWTWIGVLLCAALGACTSPDQVETAQPAPSAALGPDTRRVVFEIDYVGGAEPYVGAAGPAVSDAWDITRNNTKALFSELPRTVVVPSSLAEMQKIRAETGPYGVSKILDIAQQHRETYSSGSTVAFYAVWLDGFFEDAEGVDETVLGVALPDFGVLAMFKPAVRRLESPDSPQVSRFTEQSAFVHELGHVLGLVDTGLPLTSGHEDPDHRGHCDNPDCVMYWANEGVRDLRQFVNKLLATGSELLFDDACLSDAHAAAHAVSDGGAAAP